MLWTALVVFAAWAAYQLSWSWSLGAQKHVGIGVVLVSGVFALVAGFGGRNSRPVLRAFVFVAAVHIVWLVLSFGPSAGRDEFCGSPGAYCEDGLLVAAIPVMGVVLASAAAFAAKLIALVVDGRAASSLEVHVTQRRI
jgi:hypothetical protein